MAAKDWVQELEGLPDTPAAPEAPAPKSWVDELGDPAPTPTDWLAELAPQTTWTGLGKQVVGGVRDAVQAVVDLPAQMGNVLTEFISPDPPGGPRRRVVPEMQTPQLPDVDAPQTGLERWVRTGTTVTADLLATLARPGVKSRLARLLPPESPVRPVPLMYEPGSLASRGATGVKPTPTLAVPTGPLTGELSDGARNIAKLFQLPSEMAAIRSATQAEAAAMRATLQRVVGNDWSQLSQGPLGELYQAIEQQLLRYR